jgi:hypothetical protein
VKVVGRFTQNVVMFHNILLYITFSSVHRFTDVKAPYVGLDLAAYESSHAKTLGHESDALVEKG